MYHVLRCPDSLARAVRQDSELEKLVEFAAAENVELVAVGPEAPLCAGLADKCAAAGIACFGPTAAAARLEGSKVSSCPSEQRAWGWGRRRRGEEGSHTLHKPCLRPYLRPCGVLCVARPG